MADSPTAAPEGASRRIGIPQIAGAAIVLAFFLFFVWRGLYAHFAEDDMMNIHYYWSRGWWALVKGLALFFTTYYRPMGGVFYNVLYHFFGLNPLPYHIAITALLLLNTYLAFRFTVHISGSQLAGGLCALLVAYHAQLAWLVFLPSLVYDVLCFTFFFLALNYYLAIRQRGARLTRWQTAAFLLLYIGALEAKEMAVTLPVMVLVYEAIWHPPTRWRPAQILAWARTEAVTPLLAGLITAVYIVGKTLGPDALSNIDSYKLVFTWDRYVANTAKFLNTIFYQSLWFGFFRGSVKVVLIWTVLAYIAWRLKKRELWFLWFFVIVTPLPITFIWGRGGGCLYIPLAGWAVLASTLFLGLCGVIAREPFLRRVPFQVTRTVLVLLAVALVWRETAHQNTNIMPSM
ncbi:MAG: hypothetical protein ABSD27_13330, partial [Bryobacteraceae bacterium]